MSYCRRIGKDTIIFATEEDHKVPSTVTLPPPEPSPGLIFPDGSINWNCPCLGGMATGPCGVDFRNAFSCFHYSEADPKGSDCYDVFSKMQSCMAKYPTLYNKESSDDADPEKMGLGTTDKELPKSSSETKEIGASLEEVSKEKVTPKS